jgi:hypothetical protein
MDDPSENGRTDLTSVELGDCARREQLARIRADAAEAIKPGERVARRGRAGASGTRTRPSGEDGARDANAQNPGPITTFGIRPRSL